MFLVEDFLRGNFQAFHKQRFSFCVSLSSISFLIILSKSYLFCINILYCKLNFSSEQFPKLSENNQRLPITAEEDLKIPRLYINKFKTVSAERSSSKDKNKITKKVSCTGALRCCRVLTRSHNTHQNNVLRYSLVQKKTKIASYLLVWGWELSLVRFLNVFRSCFSNKTLIFRQTEMYRLLGHQSRKLLKL